MCIPFFKIMLQKIKSVKQLLYINTSNKKILSVLWSVRNACSFAGNFGQIYSLKIEHLQVYMSNIFFANILDISTFFRVVFPFPTCFIYFSWLTDIFHGMRVSHHKHVYVKLKEWIHQHSFSIFKATVSTTTENHGSLFPQVSEPIRHLS